MYEELRQLLGRFNDGYVRRDVDALAGFLNDLFVQDPIILGTSPGELCPGREAAERMLRNDWLYWGDFRADANEAIFHQIDDAAWFAAPATFNDHEETWGGYLEFAREQLPMCEIGPLEGLSTIAWGLSHFLFPRQPGERPYLWPTRLTGAMVRDQGRWKFCYLQFSVPISVFPDVRLGTPALDSLYSNRPFNAEGFRQAPGRAAMLQELQTVVDQLASGDIAALADRLRRSACSLVIAHRDAEPVLGAVERALAAIQQIGQLHLDYANAFSCSQASLAWVVWGEVRHTLEPEQVLRHQIAELKRLLDTDLPARDRLFQIQQATLAAISEAASGSEYRWPCRVEAAFQLIDSCWHIFALQLSFPYYWILENKIPAAHG